jgi:GNAT superfamily N-acetyltransferase
MRLEINETSFEELSAYENMLKSENVYLDTSIYTNGVESADAVHKYFIAKINNEPAGTSSMTRHISKDNDIRICHRISFSFPKYRNQGVWKSLMKHKIQYCKYNNWNESDETVHYSIVMISDMRYRNINWNLYGAYQDNTPTGKIHRATWYTSWGELKNSKI